MTARLVVVGGGYLGSEVARRLDRHLDVTLIEPREAFVHVPAMIRALVQPGLLDRALLPYDRLLRRGRVIRARATEVHPDGVTLADGRTIPADFLLVATGSDYAAPFKPRGDSIADFRADQADYASRIAAADRIVIVGAGPVGIELAGEIKAAHPEKAVTLISRDPALLSGYPWRLGQSLEKKLAAVGVTVLTGREAAMPDPETPVSHHGVSLDNGVTLVADLVIRATGAKGRADLLSQLPGVQLAEGGRVRTDPWLRPADWPNLYTGGDAASVGDAMTIVATMRQIPFLVRTLRSAAAGRPVEQLGRYRPWGSAPILLPLGPRIGNSYLPVPGRLGIMGNLVTRQLKGADLFVSKYRKTFGL